MRVRDYIIDMLWEIIYTIVMIIYLFKLNALNKELVSHNFSNAFVLLEYKDYAPLTYFVIALSLFFIGCILVGRRARRYQWGMDSFEDIVMSIIAVLVIIILLIFLIVYINNPILRAVFVVGLLVLGLFSSGK